jgi:hypothetical protein
VSESQFLNQFLTTGSILPMTVEVIDDEYFALRAEHRQVQADHRKAQREKFARRRKRFE